MHFRSTIAAVLFLGAAATAGAAIHGAWTASAWEEKSGFLQLNLSRRHSNWGHTTDTSALSGLSAAHINSTTSSPVSFEMRRDAGIIRFEGMFRNGDGAGPFDFAPNRAYLDTLRSLGVALESADDEETSLFRLAMHDVSSAFIREIQALGYRGAAEFRGYRDLPMDNYVRFRIHGVTPELVDALRSLGYDKIAADDLVRMRIHGIDANFARKVNQEH
jgi:hypothetical protein